MEILDQEIVEQDASLRRRKLLPTWIKIFIWLFLILGGSATINLFTSLLGISGNISLYGFSSSTPLSYIGLFTSTLFAYKFVVALSLWTEKDHAVKLAIIDAWIGIIVSIASMIILPILLDNYGFTLRLELLFLIPYLIKMNDIKDDWEKRKAVKMNSASSGPIERRN